MCGLTLILDACSGLAITMRSMPGVSSSKSYSHPQFSVDSNPT